MKMPSSWRRSRRRPLDAVGAPSPHTLIISLLAASRGKPRGKGFRKNMLPNVYVSVALLQKVRRRLEFP